MQILEDWEPAVWGRHLDVVEACIKFGACDTTGEARNATRMAFQAYKAGFPDRAQVRACALARCCAAPVDGAPQHGFELCHSRG